MKKIFISTLLFFCCILYSRAQDISCEDSIAISCKPPAIQESDQHIRAKLIEEMGLKNPEEIKQIAAELKISDKLTRPLPLLFWTDAAGRNV